ncbi:MAG: hypothetical protein ACTHU0_07355 [Kofleriaceae bacterium]
MTRPAAKRTGRGLHALSTELQNQVARMPAGRILARASARQPMLARYATLEAVLAMMANQHAEGWGEREAMTRVLVSEHQHDACGGFWAAALVLAYQPMLAHLRARIMGSFDADDLDSLVISSFLQTIATVNLAVVRDRTALHLRQRTARAVFGALRRETVEERGVLVRDPHELEQVLGEEPEEPQPFDAEASVVAVLDAACNHLPAEQLDLVVSTVFRREELRSYARRYVSENEPLERVYQRLKRRRTRAIMRLRGVLMHQREAGAVPMVARLSS